jgi:hypothetical protein
MRKKYVPDLPMVVQAEAEFIGILGAAPRAPQCYKELGGACASLARAREEGADAERLREYGRARLKAVETVRGYGLSGDPSIDSAFGRMESAAEAAGAAKRR